jgi:transcriptional regulator with XRE-family HTH domain
MKTIFDPRYVRLIDHLKRRRKDLGFTQAAVAQKMHRSRTWVNKLEQRERRLDVLEASMLCEIYLLPYSAIVDILVDIQRP